MPYDALLMFSNAQAITAAAPSTDTLDFGQPSVNPRSPTGARMIVNHGSGGGSDYVISVKVGGVNFAGLTALTVELQASDSPTTGFVTVATTGAVPVADLVAGYEFGFLGLPIRAKQRYWRLNYTPAGTGTAGTVTAGIADGFQTAGIV